MAELLRPKMPPETLVPTNLGYPFIGRLEGRVTIESRLRLVLLQFDADEGSA
jgi:hypothetical protein